MWQSEIASAPSLAATLAAALTTRLLVRGSPAPALALPARTTLAPGLLRTGVGTALATVVAFLRARERRWFRGTGAAPRRAKAETR